MSTEILSASPVTGDYLARLRADLAEADIVRFAVAYVSGQGLHAVGPHLERALGHADSFGVASISCACGYEPFRRVYDRVAVWRRSPPVMRYFLDPRPVDEESPDGIELLHTKMVYLRTRDGSRSVLYLGSHNWSGRALVHGHSPRNAEATVRLEAEFRPEHLVGAVSGDPFSDANQHLTACVALPMCRDAGPAEESTFQQWTAKACPERAGTEALRSVAVILAACEAGDGGLADDPRAWLALEGRSIYVHSSHDATGGLLFDRTARVLILAWPAPSAAQAAQQPVILLCRRSTSNPASTSSVHGSNQAPTPIAGFQAVLRDDGRNLATITTPSGVIAELFRLKLHAVAGNSDAEDGGVRPVHQFLLEVEAVALPIPLALREPESARRVWTPNSLAFASAATVPAVATPGFAATEEEKQAYLRCLRETFGVNPGSARVLPYSGEVNPRTGRRVTEHRLHDLFLDNESRDRGDGAFYGSSRPGDLVPERTPRERSGKGKYLARVTIAHTKSSKRIRQNWREIAEAGEAGWRAWRGR